MGAKTRFTTTALLIVLLAILLSACGGGSGGDDSGAAADSPVAEGDLSAATTEADAGSGDDGTKSDGSSDAPDSSGQSGDGNSKASGDGGTAGDAGSSDDSAKGGGSSGGSKSGGGSKKNGSEKNGSSKAKGGSSKGKGGSSKGAGGSSKAPPLLGAIDGVEDFGSEADSSEKKKAETALASYFENYTKRDWKAVCQALAAEAISVVQKLAESFPQVKGTDCVSIFSTPGLVQPPGPSFNMDSVSSFRIEGNIGFAFFQDGTLVMRLQNEGGSWKINGVLPQPYPGA